MVATFCAIKFYRFKDVNFSSESRCTTSVDFWERGGELINAWYQNFEVLYQTLMFMHKFEFKRTKLIAHISCASDL